MFYLVERVTVAAVLLLFLCMLVIWQIRKKKRKTMEQIREEGRITEYLTTFLKDAVYDPIGAIDKKVLKESGMIRKHFNTVLGEHYMKGSTKDCMIECADLELMMVRYRLNNFYELIHEEISCFEGTWFVLTVNEPVADYVMFVGKKSREYYEDEENYLTRDIRLNECYYTYIYGELPEELQISDQIRDYLMRIYELFDGRLKVLMVDKKIHIVTEQLHSSIEIRMDYLKKIMQIKNEI